MRVRLLYFGMLKDLLGTAAETVDLDEAARVEDVLRLLRDRASNRGMGQEIWNRLAVAVNRDYAGADVVLRENDEVALLPPVSGGAAR